MLARTGTQAAAIASRLGQQQIQVRTLQITSTTLNKGIFQGAKEKVEDLAHKAKEKAEHLAEKVKETTHNAAEKTKEKVHDFKDQYITSEEEIQEQLKKEAQNAAGGHGEAQGAKDAAKQYTHHLSQKTGKHGERMLRQ